MKDIKECLDEALTRSYNTNKLIEKIFKRYPNTEYYKNNSKSKEYYFSIQFKNKKDYNDFLIDIYIQHQLDFFGYYITIKNDKDLFVSIESNFGTKCTKFVYNDCNGLVFHVTSKEKYEIYIKDQGLNPFEGQIYRKFTERVFLSCGKTKKEIIDNIKYLIKQLNIKEYVILMVNLKKHKYNVDFYYDPSEDDWHNFIYCNAWFPITYIDKINNIEDIKLNIDENLQVSNYPWRQS